MSGFKRLVKVGALKPWFYAIGGEVLYKDYVLSSGLEDDPVFMLGVKFVIPEGDGISTVKTCMGCRLITEERDFNSSSRGPNIYRMVYFDDGSTVRIYNEGSVSGCESIPRQLFEEEKWVTDAIEQFRAVLTGKKEGFQFKFTDGRTFTAKLASKGKSAPSVEGDYFLKVTYTSGGKKEGWVRDFVPTDKFPDIIKYVCEKSQLTPAQIKVVKCIPKKDGKKWSGVFYTQKPD